MVVEGNKTLVQAVTRSIVRCSSVLRYRPSRELRLDLYLLSEPYKELCTLFPSENV